MMLIVLFENTIQRSLKRIMTCSKMSQVFHMILNECQILQVRTPEDGFFRDDRGVCGAFSLTAALFVVGPARATSPNPRLILIGTLCANIAILQNPPVLEQKLAFASIVDIDPDAVTIAEVHTQEAAKTSTGPFSVKWPSTTSLRHAHIICTAILTTPPSVITARGCLGGACVIFAQ